MTMKKLQSMVNRGGIKRERVITVQKAAVGMGIIAALGVALGAFISSKAARIARENSENNDITAVKAVNNAVQKKVKTIKCSTAHVEQDVYNAIKNLQGKTEGVKKDIEDGCQEITQDVHKTAENISDELKN